ncbi:arsenate reductase ArsC [Nocardia sp. NBC_01503]|uniref:arsenate reductase/protein-tyrosine-phosphatase family protein n=1 Tax=Nocardia sp. NBC_01503 TaxID=2975997 RepID=UPI002E7BB0D0|nr:arsenate reductase ArsC [Nocardia sp. NBC_01503]WTL30987.1 arsenate reductase ArsC [Nocardia sp. NBC_01503]
MTESHADGISNSRGSSEVRRATELEQAAARLREEFAQLCDANTIDRMVTSSYERLAAFAADTDRLPFLAERFARERLIALLRAVGRSVGAGPAVLFVCTHNAGRSQMALGFFTRMVGGGAVGWAGGSAPDAVVNPQVVAAMAERGIDLADEFPKPWTDELMRAADVVVDMGCGDTDPILSGHRFEQWPLADPAGQGIEEIRVIRDEIERRVSRLIANLGLSPATEGVA